MVLLRKAQVKCQVCGKVILKRKSRVHEHNFCCPMHLRQWNAQRLSHYNRTKNPMNRPGGVLAARIKRGRQLRGTGEGKTYRKWLGRHEHRHVAEAKIGRPLRAGEVVHHLDGNKLNNTPSNLVVLSSQAEHCKAHGFGQRKGGDAQ